MKIFKYLVLLSLFFISLAACGGQEPAPADAEQPEAAPDPTAVPTDTPPAVAVNDILNIAWQWADLVETSPASQSVVPDPENYLLIFRNDGTVNIKADCNVVQGSYTLDGANLTIQTGPTTMAFCGEASLDNLFLGHLAQVVTAALEDGRLFLTTTEEARLGFNNGGAVEGERVEPVTAAVFNIEWQWADLVETAPAGQSVVPNPQNYTITFFEDNRASIKADCNVVNTTYSLDGNQLTIEFETAATTLAFCGEDSLDNQYLGLLAQVVSATLEDGRLLLHLAADAGRMGFQNGGAVPPPQSEVTGSVVYRKRIALPEDAVLQVQLQDTSLADAPAKVIGEQKYVTAGAQVPLPFAVSYDPTAIDERFEYSLSIRIEDAAGNLLFINDTVIPVITRGNPTSDIEAMVISVNGGGADSEVTGSVIYRERLALPDDARLRIQVQDTSLADAPATIIGEQNYVTEGAQVPLDFAIPYNSAVIQENRDYTISARIFDAGGNLLFINDMVIPVISKGNPTSGVQVLVVSVGGGSPAPDIEDGSILNQLWMWTSFTDPESGPQEIPEPQRYQLVLNDDGTINVQADCNMVQGTYTLDEGSIMIELGPTTLAACPPDSLADQFTQSLTAARIWFTQEGDLFFDLFADSGTMRFAHSMPNSSVELLVGPVWEWTDIREANTTSAIPNPEAYTIQFMDDGTATILADCNQVGANYTVDGSNMSIELGASTQAFCGDDSLDQQYLQSLTATTLFFFENQQLLFELSTDNGRMWFRDSAQ